MRFRIRNKIAVCFLVPVAFLMVIGISAYQKAAEGMSRKFEESTLETVKMATQYIDMSCNFIEAEGTRYAFDSDISNYSLGMDEKDPVKKSKVVSSIRSNILYTQTLNPFISNIHIVTKKGITMLSTKTAASAEGCFEDYRETISGDRRNLGEWIDSHEQLDACMKWDDSDYIMSYEVLLQSKNACVLIDIKRSAIQDFLQKLDIGKGSIIGFVTHNGREVIYENCYEGETAVCADGENIFWEEDFFQEIKTQESLYGSKEVRFKGEEYLFIYSRSTMTDAAVCALVPVKMVISQAREIEKLTVYMVILACAVVLGIGIMITAGIENNMKYISRKFGEVAEGDLTVKVAAKSKDEFLYLAKSASDMIVNTKKLVNKVANATEQLEESADNVGEVSVVVDEYSKDITRAISEINEGMTRQSAYAQKCVNKAECLSDEMKEVNCVIELVGKLVDETENMISQGIGIVQMLGSRAEKTTAIAETVGKSIELLRRESERINTFVEMITGISEQTNLLSLNASIEAARAGEAGKGFSVVAEQICRLAEDSAKAAGEISRNVANISVQTMNSVKCADKARSMVNLQSEAVEEVITVFCEISERMHQLVEGLRDIAARIECADMERGNTVIAVKNISDIIEETAASAEIVNQVANKLMHNVEKMNNTANVLGENMEELKSEISVFKI